MSYILDALKKSENERRAGATPGLAPAASYVVLPQHRSRHRGVALMVAVGMLGTGLALGNWRPWQEDIAGVEAPLAAPVGASVPTRSPLATGAESPVPAKPLAKVSTKTLPMKTPKALTVAEKKRSVPPPNRPPVVVAVAKPAALPAASATSATAGASPAPGLPAQMAAVPPAAVPAAAVPVAVVAPVAAAPAARVQAYRDLPAAVQGALPAIVFGGFAGGGEADGRIAFINNRLVREGEEVSPGLRLEAVDQDGVVLGFQGHHFRATQ